jgi:hypothetical protein
VQKLPKASFFFDLGNCSQFNRKIEKNIRQKSEIFDVIVLVLTEKQAF